jgi:predicted alpha-1,6-mannanase (GH76 family)
MNRLTYCLLLAATFITSSSFAFTTNDANTVFDAYNKAFQVGGYYPGWWTGAEEIEMAEDAYENSPTLARQNNVANACSQFVANHTANWISGGGFNKYNDDIAWAVIAFARGYLITGNTTFRNIAKTNWDNMYARAWDTNFTGGGLWWNTDNMFKNAAVNGPAAIGACLLYSIYSDPSYLTKAQAIYAWERRVLLNSSSGSIADGITWGNATTTGGATTYNQGTFIGAANLLYRVTGLPNYYQDALLVGKYTQKNMSSAAGILPEYSSGNDLSGFNGIFCRWIARYAKDQRLWTAFGPWLGTNANAAWSIRNSTNLAWQKWATPMGTNAPDAWGCSAAVVVMQVADPSPADVLQISPAYGFVGIAERSMTALATSVNFLLTNTGAGSVNWSLANTSSWLSASSVLGTLLPGGNSTNVIVSLVGSMATDLAPGRYYAHVVFTNLPSGSMQNRLFELIIAASNAPVLVSGLNASVMAANTATSAAPGATSFDIPNSYCLFQAGTGNGSRGLPPDGAFTSQLDRASVFQFNYGVTNALVLGNTYPASGTITLATPQAYNTLAILACSANAAGTVGTLVFNFTNGTQSQVFNFNAQDWFNNTNNVAIQGFGRLKLGASFNPEDSGPQNPNLYQTTINLAALGLNQPIASITFTKPSGAAGNQTTGIFAISGTVMPPFPAMAVQPQSVINNQPAQGVTFAGVAGGAPPLAYQWYYSVNGSPGSYVRLTGQTNTTLQLSPPLQTTNAGNYVVVVTNAYGAVTSSVATLALHRAPVIVQQPTPTNVFAFAGASNTFFMTANAALPMSYYWRRGGTLVPTAIGSNCVLLNLQTTNSGAYTVVVSNAFGMVPSSAALLTVAPAPSYPYGQLLLADHPIGYWRMDELDTFVAHDYVAGNNGVYTPDVLLGHPGNNLVDTNTCPRFGYLASSNSCVTNVNVDFATTGNAAFAVEAWVWGPVAPSTDAGLVTKGYGGGGEQFNLDCGAGGHAFRFFVRDAGGGAHVANSSVVPNSQWHHLVGVCDQVNGGVYLYVDGVRAGSTTIGTNTGLLTSTLPASFGSRKSGAGTAYDLQFTGYIADVAIYNYVLSSNRVATHFLAATNRAPAFFSNPFTKPGITTGTSYSGTLATNASDPNGDTMTFSKLSGPAWLGVAGNGSLAGTPLASDAGTNVFLVKVSDPAGLFSTATLNLPVVIPPFMAGTAGFQGTNLVLVWSGGTPPYQVWQATSLLSQTWQPFGPPTSATSLSVSVTNPAAFYRIGGQ